MEENKQLEKVINRLKTNYKYIFNTDEGKEVLVDLEKRCHYHASGADKPRLGSIRRSCRRQIFGHSRPGDKRCRGPHGDIIFVIGDERKIDRGIVECHYL